MNPEIENIRNYNLVAVLKTKNNIPLNPIENAVGQVVYPVEITPAIAETMEMYQLGNLQLEPQKLLRTRDLIFDIARVAKAGNRL
jgi:hypothetical protein